MILCLQQLYVIVSRYLKPIYSVKIVVIIFPCRIHSLSWCDCCCFCDKTQNQNQKEVCSNKNLIDSLLGGTRRLRTTPMGVDARLQSLCAVPRTAQVSKVNKPEYTVRSNNFSSQYGDDRKQSNFPKTISLSADEHRCTVVELCQLFFPS